MSDVAILYLGVGALFSCPIAIGIVGRWINDRASAETAAATFDRDFIPQVPDVADQDYPAIVAEIEATLDDCIEHVERLLFAAEIAELEETG